jgi:hypothetical protein
LFAEIKSLEHKLLKQWQTQFSKLIRQKIISHSMAFSPCCGFLGIFLELVPQFGASANYLCTQIT